MSESTRLQMKEELAMLHALDHPYIVKAVQSFDDNKYMYTVMEYLEGKSLQDYIDKKGEF
jgi:serine/threonine protein kinase